MVDVVIPVSVPSGVGTTRRRYRRRLADEMGQWMETTTSAVASHGDPARVVLADELRDDESGYEFAARDWLYVRDGAQQDTQRRILSQTDVGYQGARGAFVVSRPFNAALAEGVTIEATSPLPCKRHAGVKGYNDFVNEALTLCRVVARLTFTGNGTNQQSLAAYPFVYSDDDIHGLYETDWSGVSSAPVPTASAPTVASNGITRTLVLPRAYATSETYYLDVLVRGDRLVYDGSAWGYLTGETTGLSADTHQGAAPEGWVVAFGAAKGFEYLLELTGKDETLSDAVRERRMSSYERRRVRWTRTANRIRMYAFPRMLTQASDSPVSAGLWVPSTPSG